MVNAKLVVECNIVHSLHWVLNPCKCYLIGAHAGLVKIKLKKPKEFSTLMQALA